MRAALKEARLKRNLTVIEISEKVGISPWFYYKIEQGVRNPGINLARKIAIVLGGTVDELFFSSHLDEMPKLA